MTQQEIEEATKATKAFLYAANPPDGESIQAVEALLDLAKFHLSVMKSGIPKRICYFKRDFNRLRDYEKAKLTEEGYNQAVDDFTAYLAQKLEGLEGVIRESSLYDLCSNYIYEREKEVKDLATAIRKHLKA